MNEVKTTPVDSRMLCLCQLTHSCSPLGGVHFSWAREPEAGSPKAGVSWDVCLSLDFSRPHSVPQVVITECLFFLKVTESKHFGNDIFVDVSVL